MPIEEELSELEEQLMGLDDQEKRKRLNAFVKTLPKEELEKLKMQQCVFCLLASNKIKSYRVYEDSKFLAVLDINPSNPGQVLLFPKKHYQFLSLLPEKETAEMFVIANQISKALLQELKAQGVNLIISSGTSAGQKVDHISMSIIPRFQNDGIGIVLPARKVAEKDLEKIYSLLKGKISVQKGEKVELKPIKKEHHKTLEKHAVLPEKRMP